MEFANNRNRLFTVDGGAPPLPDIRIGFLCNDSSLVDLTATILPLCAYQQLILKQPFFFELVDQKAIGLDHLVDLFSICFYCFC